MQIAEMWNISKVELFIKHVKTLLVFNCEWKKKQTVCSVSKNYAIFDKPTHVVKRTSP